MDYDRIKLSMHLGLQLLIEFPLLSYNEKHLSNALTEHIHVFHKQYYCTYTVHYYSLFVGTYQIEGFEGVLSFCFEEVGVWPTNSYSVSIENEANCFWVQLLC